MYESIDTGIIDLIFKACCMPLFNKKELSTYEETKESAKKYAEAKEAVIKKGLERFSTEEQKEILSEIYYMLDSSIGFQAFAASKEFPDIVPGISTIKDLPDKFKLFFGLDYEDLPLLLSFDDNFKLYKDIKGKIISWRLLRGK